MAINTSAFDPTKKPKVGAGVAAAVQGYKPPTTPVTPPAATPGVTTPPNAVTGVKPPVTPPAADPMAKFGGKDAYIKSQLGRFTGGSAELQGKINKDLSRFGVTASPITGRPEKAGFGASSLVGATLGGDSNGQYFQLPDGSREWIDTPEELEIANQIGSYNAGLEALKGQQAAEMAQNQSDYNYVTNQLNSSEAVANQGAQELQNRRGGFYSGGLDYQLGGIQRGYAEQRGQLAQDFQRANQALQAKYGAQTAEITNNLNNLLSTAPGLINQSIAAAAQAKKDANIKAAQDFYNTYGYAVKPQDDHSGFWRQVSSGQAGLGQKEQLEVDKFAADNQKEYVANLWKAADTSGVVPKELADLYPGLQAGMETREARQWAAEQGLRQDASDLNWIREDRLGREGGGGTDSGVSSSAAGDRLKTMLTEEYDTGNIDSQGNNVFKERLTKDKGKLDDAAYEIISAGITEKDFKNAMLASGAYSSTDIQKYIDAYKGNFLGK